MQMKKTRLRPVAKVKVPPTAQKRESQRILVVDDDLFACHRNAEVLIRQGYEVITSEYCETGWEELQANPFSLLIAKKEMPNMTGTELVTLLRSVRISLPVILITEQLPKLPPARQLELNPMVTLLKPSTPEEILAAVRAVLGASPVLNEEMPPPNWNRQPSPVDLQL